jgi:hypothetical protein
VRTSRFVGLVTLLGFESACGPKAPPPAAIPERPYECVLHPLATLGPDFMVRQHVEASGHGRGGGFDAVLQKRGDALVVVGLVAGIRAFVLKQEGEKITFEQSLGPKMPFPPSYAIIDVHRVYWKRLPRDPSAPASGTVEGELDGEHVREVWSNGELAERRFTRPGEFEGSVSVQMGPGCTAALCRPKTVKIVNEWFGYTVAIENDEFTAL